MKPHDAFLELAAAAIDFPLSASERRRLEAHLAGCAACARSTTGLRADAMTLAELPRITLPERQGAVILAAALHPTVVRRPLRLVAIAALVALLLLGSLFVGAEVVRRIDEEQFVVLPVPTATPASSPAQSGQPSAEPTVRPSPGLIAGPTTGALAVTHGDGSERTWIEVVALDGLAVTRLADGRDPAWASDTQLLYTCPFAATAEFEASTEICIVDPAAPGAVETTFHGVDRPAPGPDGRALAVHVGMIDVGETWVSLPDVADPVTLPGAFLRWSPDGTWLLGQPESAAFEVAIVRADGTGLEVLSGGRDPAWSPTGDRIAFVMAGEVADALHVLTLASRATEQRFIAPTGAVLSVPAWLPDGTLVFAMDGDLWRLDPGAAEPFALTTGLQVLAEGLGDPLDVSPDGRWIAFTNGSGTDTEVGVASVDGGWTLLDLGDGPVTQPRWRPLPDVPVPSGDPGASPGTAGPLGVGWATATVPEVPADRPVGRIEAATAGGPGFVAVGRGCAGDEPACEAVVWLSADGRTWTRPPAQDALDTGWYVEMSGPEVGMFDVASGAPGVVAIGYAARPDLTSVAWFSADGMTWERIPFPSPAGTWTHAIRLNAVTWDGRQFVVVGEDRSQFRGLEDLGTATVQAAVWTSPDGRTWTRARHTKALDAGGFIDTTEDPATGGMRDIVAGPGGLVAVGSVCQSKTKDCVPAAWTSRDGASWTRSGGLPELSAVLKAVAATDAGFVAVGAQTCGSSPVAVPGGCPALVLTSPDGVTWTVRPFEQAGDLRTITVLGDRLLATSPDGPVTVWASDDGSSWAPLEPTGGPAPEATGGEIAEWHFAAGPAIGVWLGTPPSEDGPAAWVSGG